MAIALFPSANAFAFDIDGLKTGMPRDKAIAQLQGYGLSITSKDDNVIASAADRFYSLNFCMGSLVNIQKNLTPTFVAFVQVISHLKAQYGAPIGVFSETPNPTHGAPSHGLTITWRDKGELVSVTHNVFTSNNQTYIMFEARNPCYRHPLLSQ